MSYHFGKLSPVLLLPRYGLKTQRIIRGSPHKKPKKYFVTFLFKSQFFFRPWQNGPQGGCTGPLKKNLCNGLWNIENFAKMHFFQKVTPIFFSFLTCKSKNLKFLLSKQCSILKFFQFLVSKISKIKLG